MTFGELDKYSKEKLEQGIHDHDIDDWRPAVWMYIEDIAKVKDGWVDFPFGIRYWLKNGDSIIYVKRMKD